MQCPYCGSEKFEIIRKYSNLKYNKETKKKVRNHDTDLRKMVCSECHRVLITETSLIYGLSYSDEKCKEIETPIEKLKEKVGKSELF